MAEFDDQLAAVKAQMLAATEVLQDHPDVAAKVAAAMAEAQPDPVTVEEAAQDQARANALARAMEAVQQKLPAPAVRKPTLDAKGKPQYYTVTEIDLGKNTEDTK